MEGKSCGFLLQFFCRNFFAVFQKNGDNVEKSHPTFIYKLEFNFRINNVVNIPR